MTIPLIIAAHGTRDTAGETSCRALVALVAERLAPTPVSVGFVELNYPGITEAVEAALEQNPSADRAVVVPLMLGTGGHVRADIPAAIEAARLSHPNVHLAYAPYLGGDPRLLRVLAERVATAATGWDARETAVVLVGRGTLDANANADHARLARLLVEEGGVAQVLPAYAQVARPGLPEALNQLYAVGHRRIVVAVNLLFEGRLFTWMDEQARAWEALHPDAEVRRADVIGPCGPLVDVVVDRYRQAADVSPAEVGSPAYLTGLLLSGRRVVMVGAGRVADRRVGRLLAAGALVHVISPSLSVPMRRLVDSGALTWSSAPFGPEDLADTWFVLAQTNDPEVNATVVAAAEERRIFCVRADDGRLGSAWTPATERVGGVTVGVLGRRDPELSVRVRDAVVRQLLHL